jgi:hypothetical protein
MTTSCWTSKSSLPAPLTVALALAVTALIFVGCSDGDEAIGDCENEETPNLVGHPSAALHRALVRVVQEDVGGTVERTALASFLDHTKVETTSRPLDMQIGDSTCFALTGNPVSTCRKGFTEPCLKEKLKITKVDFEGVSGGTLTLDAANLTKEGLAAPIYAGTVRVKVTGASGEGSFPDYEMSMAAPEVLRIKCPDATQPVGTKDFSVCWNAGDPAQGDVITIGIRSTETGVTDKAVCLELDDGCHTIRAGVLDWLEIKTGETFTVTVTRDRASVKKIDGNRSALFSLKSQVKLTMTR